MISNMNVYQHLTGIVVVGKLTFLSSGLKPLLEAASEAELVHSRLMVPRGTPEAVKTASVPRIVVHGGTTWDASLPSLPIWVFLQIGTP